MRFLEIFREITSIPHCSGDTKELKDYLVEFAIKNSLELKSDISGNVLISSRNPKVCFQSHYDMVCVGEYNKIEVIEDKGFLKAKSSSLGADNGIGVALILEMLENGCEIEGLFTNDEEIGLIGAMKLELEIKSKTLINLDAEELGSVYVGCAGGFDCEVSFEIEESRADNKLLALKTVGFRGGHSGVQIDEGIKNAIKELAFFIRKNNLKCYKFGGGERSNSIPVNAYAVVNKKDIKIPEWILTEEVNNTKTFDMNEIISKIISFPTGVRDYDKHYNVVKSSVNLALCEMTKQNYKITISARSFDEEELENMKLEIKEFFKNQKIKFDKEYPSWKPQDSNISKKLKTIFEKHNINSNIKVIHAGLECGILQEKLNIAEIISIGPNIFNPHTISEKVEINSVIKLKEVLNKLLNTHS